MSRANLTYGERQAWKGPARGADVSQPIEGFYRFKLGKDTIAGGVRIWFGAPADPVTGEELDRSWRWQALFNDEPIDFDRVWPACTKEPISEADYRAKVNRVAWAKQRAPDSPYAERGCKLDRLSPQTPMQF